MTSDLGTFVLDCSVVAKLFVSEPYSDLAGELLVGLGHSAGPVVHVPDLLFVECANTLRKWVVRFGLPPEHARSSVECLLQLPFEVAPTVDLLPAATRLALARGVSVYDACYVALGRQLDVPLLTADHRLANALPDWAVWLGDVAL